MSIFFNTVASRVTQLQIVNVIILQWGQQMGAY